MIGTISKLQHYRVYMTHLNGTIDDTRKRVARGYKCMRGRNEDAADVYHTLDAIVHYATQRKARWGRGRDN